MSDNVRTIEVKVDTTARDGAQPKDEIERLTWEVLDTTYALLREYAVRVALVEVRSQLAAQGATDLPADEELFKAARESGDPTAPTGYMDLAPDVEMAAYALNTSLDLLARQALLDAAEGLGLGIEESGE